MVNTLSGIEDLDLEMRSSVYAYWHLMKLHPVAGTDTCPHGLIGPVRIHIGGRPSHPTAVRPAG